jgi:hypothetical protein
VSADRYFLSRIQRPDLCFAETTTETGDANLRLNLSPSGYAFITAAVSVDALLTHLACPPPRPLRLMLEG